MNDDFSLKTRVRSQTVQSLPHSLIQKSSMNWSAISLAPIDRQFSTIQYQGHDISTGQCIIATTKIGSALIEAMVGHSNPVGYFLITNYSIENPINYANGDTPRLQAIKRFRNPVYQLERWVIIDLQQPTISKIETINKIFESVNPENIIVISSANIDEDFIQFPSESFPRNFTMTGIEAGIVTISEVKEVNCTIFYINNQLNTNSLSSFCKELSAYVILNPLDLPISTIQILKRREEDGKALLL